MTEENASPMKLMALGLIYIMIPALFFFGTFGNILTVIVLVRPFTRPYIAKRKSQACCIAKQDCPSVSAQLRKISTEIATPTRPRTPSYLNTVTIKEPGVKYKQQFSSIVFLLCALSITDLLYLYVGPTQLWLLEVFQINLRGFGRFACKLSVFLIPTMTQSLNWTLVLLTIDRFIWVTFPFKAKQICTVRNALMLFCGVAFCAFALNFHLILNSDLAIEPHYEHPFCSSRGDFADLVMF